MINDEGEVEEKSRNEAPEVFAAAAGEPRARSFTE